MQINIFESRSKFKFLHFGSKIKFKSNILNEKVYPILLEPWYDFIILKKVTFVCIFIIKVYKNQKFKI